MKNFNNSITDTPTIGTEFEFGIVREVQTEHLDREMQISFHFNIDDSKQQLLEQKVNNGEILSISDIYNNFSPNIDDVKLLIDWLNVNGFTGVTQSYDKCSVYAKSTADNISSKLQCELIAIENNGVISVGVSTSPSLPLIISNSVY